MGGRGRANEAGQATVELALCLPLLALVLGAVVELSLLASDQVRLWHAAREAARAAAVEPDASAAEAAAEQVGLDAIVVSVTPDAAFRVRGEPVTATVTYRPQGHVPLLSEAVSRLELEAKAVMRIEQP
ncbi:MAG TPA: TadE/TadG family type IV pilus assembly protein [Actinomycetota bacterium]|nr:TadE/TadG family type IV pilus assembly protein [Actinomycetota bacterium]